MKSSIKSYAVLAVVGLFLVSGVVFGTMEILRQMSDESAHSVMAMVSDTGSTYRSMLDRNKAFLELKVIQEQARQEAEALKKLEAEVKAEVERLESLKEDKQPSGDDKLVDGSMFAPDAGTAEEGDNSVSRIVVQPDGSRVYHVQVGDTLSLVSHHVGYSVDELAKLNQIQDVNLIYAGSVLRLPDEK